MGSWKIMAMERPRCLRMDSSGNDISDWPAKIMFPVTCAVGGRRRRRASEVADLPEPDSPTSPSVSPGFIVNDTLCTTSRLPKAMQRSSIWSRGESMGCGDGSESVVFLLDSLRANVR